MLEQLQTEREHGCVRNLIGAATGTGKTVVAAFDHPRLCKQVGRCSRLLFIVHRIEIRDQPLLTYREVLRDGSFGQLLSGHHPLNSPDYLFAMISARMRNCRTSANISRPSSA